MEEFPEGHWIALDSTVQIATDPERDELLDQAKCYSLGEELMQFSSYDQLEVEDDGEFTFNLNNVKLKNREEGQRFFQLMKQLKAACGDYEMIEYTEFYDDSTPAGGLMYYDWDDEGNVRMKVAYL